MKSLIASVALVTSMAWWQLWFTPDQQGDRLMQRGQFAEAAETFHDPMRIGVAWYRASEFEKAEQAFARSSTAEAEFNRGNAWVMQGKYEEAIDHFDHALELRPHWEDAETNREIAITRAERISQEGGEMGDQRIGADEIRFDNKKQPGGQETEAEQAEPLSDAAMQALWLRRVNTKPADFLKSKFAFQLAQDSGTSGSKSDRPEPGGKQ